MTDFSEAQSDLYAAVWNNNIRWVADILAGPQAVINLNDQDGIEWFTPLMVAVCNDSTQIVQMLLNAGADQRLRSGEGQTALFYAVAYGSAKTVCVLLANLLRLDVDVKTIVCSLKFWAMRRFRTQGCNMDADILSMLLAADEHCVDVANNSIGCDKHKEHWGEICDDCWLSRACWRDMVQKAACTIMQRRITEICFAMQNMRLPTLLTVMILEEACAMPNTEFKMYHLWTLAAKVKHWRD